MNGTASTLSAIANKFASASSEPLSEIPARLADLSLELTNLNDALGDLCARLEPVLAPVGAESGKCVGESPSRTAVGRSIQEIHMRAEHARMVILGLIDRLEV